MKNAVLRFFAIAVLGVVSFPLYAGGSDASAELYLEMEKISSLSASFQQVVKDHEGYVVQEVGGILKLSRPNKVYWETFAPYEQLVVGNESRLWIYDPDLEQVTIQPIGDTLEGPLALLSNSLEELQAKYDVERAPSDSETRFVLVPRDVDESGSFSDLVFGFNQGELSSIVITDKLRQTTKIVLSDVSLNENLPSSTFEFVAPEGVDVVVNER